jgi:hypothetical protein
VRPLSLAERGLGPTSVSLQTLLTGKRDPSRAQLDGYLARIVDRDMLERLWIVEPLPGWLPSRNLAQAPRHHLVDPALAARLLGGSEGALLQGVRAPFSAALAPSEQLTPRDGTLLTA